MKGTLTIHTEKLLPIIKKWLYSDKEIFLRELVSNASDALSKLKILRDEKLVSFEDASLRIDITLNKGDKTLKIADNGIGMTANEVEKYIAQLAFSGAEEFLEKYRSSSESDQVIGHFGLGFYSAYMVSSKVEIQTLSYQEGAEPAFWSCDGGVDYTLEKGNREQRGTELTLFIEDEEFLEERKLREILDRYCAFLPYPIYLNGEHLNHKEPLWLKPASECTEEEYLAFYRKLYPLDKDPLFWIHLNVDVPFHLKGILYFPKLDARFDFQKPAIKLFCNRVFVSDNCQDLIPDYLMVLKGALDSPDIPLNVSRSYLQMDKTVRSLGAHISKKVADRLSTLFRTERARFETHFEDIELILKLGILQDEKFYEKIKDLVLWKTIDGSWTTMSEYGERNGKKTDNTLFYTQDPHAACLSLYREKEIEVLIAKGALDSPLMNFLETKYAPAKFQRIDGGLNPLLLDPEKEKSLLHEDGRPQYAHIADKVKEYLEEIEVKVEAKSLASSSIPAFTLIKEETRRLKEALALHKQTIPMHLMEEKTFIVNTNSPLVQSLLASEKKEVAKLGIKHLYHLANLGQKELSPEEMQGFIAESYLLLEKLLAPSPAPTAEISS